jgi:hypothetical protein
VTFRKFTPKNLLVKAPLNASREQYFVHKPELMMKGYYIFLGWDNRGGYYAGKLYDHTGEQLHTWIVDYNKLDSDGPLNGVDTPHGFKVLRDGSILVTFDKGDILVRVGSCGQPIWTKQGVYHHLIGQAEDGSFWCWRGLGSERSQYQYLVNFEPTHGRTIREIGLVEDIIKKMGDASAVFLIRPDFRFQKVEENSTVVQDIFHPNDIEVLSTAMASKFPAFEAGDLMISLRNLDLVAVIDPDDLKLKWWSYGPWRRQHDPDFTSDGNISVYNNNRNLGRSEIIKINPSTMEISNDLFDGDVHFYSSAMGLHQYLPNGNVLIVVPAEGRVLVVSSTGQKVLEYNNITTDKVDYNGHVENGLWLPLGYFQDFPECSS